ncbi:MAG: hypothetical protein EPO52_06285 [Herbiconiux sp.]|uniref:Vgb family protein n=1 Tax=Herbiconiux sp. TaxID=1871186 RepID=UPI00120E2FDF|nr:hypothetical protein [Herbiconiux sp.]TAJ47813.1 MAG: hypothetical protein EPO52_06285 [Herbiconiux sp.]
MSTSPNRLGRGSTAAALALALMAPAAGLIVSSPVAAIPLTAHEGAAAPSLVTVSSAWHEAATATPGGLPTTVAVDPAGSLWYADYTHDQLVRIDISGGERVFGLSGPKAHVTSIVAGPDGTVWFSDQAHRTIGRIFPGSGLEKRYRLDDARVNATSLAAGIDRVWFAAGPAGLGYIFPSGEVDYARLGGATTIDSIDVAPDGRVWFAVSGGTSIGVYDPATTTTRMIDVGVGALSDIAVAPDGSVWVGGDNALMHVATDDSVAVVTLAARSFEHIAPRSITFDSLGQLYFTDLNRGIGVLDAHGTVTYETAPSGAVPWDLAMVGDSLWFNDMGRSTLGWL